MLTVAEAVHRGASRPSPRDRPVRVLVFVLLALPWTSFMAQAQSIRSDFSVPNGPVTATALLGNTLYIGGEFTHVGPVTESGVPLDALTGSPAVGFPKVAGCINAVADDGAGGWYVGGRFISVGGIARTNIAHIASDLSVTSWNPHAEGGAVVTLLVRGNTVYAGGSFTSVHGAARNRLAAIDATTGQPTAWNPALVES